MKYQEPKVVVAFENFLFSSRWLQAPLYFGLIAAQCLYVWIFLKEVWHLFHTSESITETAAMLSVLGLIDIVMISNLIYMVILGGYSTFVSKINIDKHPDKPEWFSHVDAGVLKVKLSIALISISSIHLLKTFVDISNTEFLNVLSQLLIHISFIVSAWFLCRIDKLLKDK